MTQVEDTWKLIRWENWKINCGIGKRKNPDIQTGLTGTQVCAFSFCKALMFAPWWEGGTACTHRQVESHDRARGVKVLNKVSNFAESKLRACCIIVAFFSFASPLLASLCRQLYLKTSHEVPGGCSWTSSSIRSHGWVIILSAQTT